MSGIGPKIGPKIPGSTPLLGGVASSPQPAVPLRNEELRTILSDLKAGNQVSNPLLDRFLSDTPLKEHPTSVLEKTTDQGVLLVALAHLLRGSLVDDHTTFKTAPDPSNKYKVNAERVLGTNLNAFKEALTKKIEAFHGKDMKTKGKVGIGLSVAVDIPNPFHWLGIVKDVVMGAPKDELGNRKLTASLYNDGFRANFIGKKVEQALTELKKPTNPPAK
jgi:hypothetical protein